MNNLDQKIKEFSNYILQTPEFAGFQKAAEKLESDKEALSILQDTQQRQQTIATFQQNGLPVSPDQELELKNAFAKLRANEICMEYLRSQNLAVALARKICNQLTQETGIPFAGGGGCCG
jgi:cell fate (sporulation/competence/biofilm development) regulator YlbF (YheA/YmcA/DUF963 family)